MKKVLLVFLLPIFAITACSPKTPMQKLESDVRYDDMVPAFWEKELKQNTPLWDEALDYCKTHSEKPNCPSVMQVYIINNGSKTAPAIGHSGNTLETPNF